MNYRELFHAVADELQVPFESIVTLGLLAHPFHRARWEKVILDRPVVFGVGETEQSVIAEAAAIISERLKSK